MSKHCASSCTAAHTCYMYRRFTVLHVRAPHHASCTGTSPCFMYRHLTVLHVQALHRASCTGSSHVLNVQAPHTCITTYFAGRLVLVVIVAGRHLDDLGLFCFPASCIELYMSSLLVNNTQMYGIGQFRYMSRTHSLSGSRNGDVMSNACLFWLQADRGSHTHLVFAGGRHAGWA